MSKPNNRPFFDASGPVVIDLLNADDPAGYHESGFRKSPSVKAARRAYEARNHLSGTRAPKAVPTPKAEPTPVPVKAAKAAKAKGRKVQAMPGTALRTLASDLARAYWNTTKVNMTYADACTIVGTRRAGDLKAGMDLPTEDERLAVALRYDGIGPVLSALGI